MRFEIKRATTPNQNMGGGKSGLRIGLAAFGAVIIGGISVGLVVFGPTDSTRSSALHVRRAVAVGAPASQTTASSGSYKVPAVQVSRGVVTPAVRD